jgi:hypothetical protein
MPCSSTIATDDAKRQGAACRYWDATPTRGNSNDGLYQGGRDTLGPVQVAAQIGDMSASPRFYRTRTFGAEEFAGTRSAAYLLDLPLAALGSGELRTDSGGVQDSRGHSF